MKSLVSSGATDKGRLLDERHPAAALLPAVGTPERAQALRWLLFLASELYPIVEINDYPERFAPEGIPADAVRERARAIWRERWLILEAQIQGDPWLLPSGFCFTDVYLAALSRWAQQGDFRRDPVPERRLRASPSPSPRVLG